MNHLKLTVLMLLLSLTTMVSAQGQHYVDLGMPSGIFWGVKNVNASSAETPGQAVQWGGTTNSYNCDYLFSSELDGNELGMEQDYANTTLHGTWRIPSKDEWEELVANCTITKDTVEGAVCLRFTSNVPGYTDRSIVLPACGYKNCYGGNVGWGKRSAYWTSTGRGDGSQAAYCMNFLVDDISNTQTPDYISVKQAMLVRPVYAKARAIQLEPMTLAPGKQEQAKLTTLPRLAEHGALTWAVDDPTICTVDQNGNVTALKHGSTLLHATCTEATTQTLVNVQENMVDLGVSVRWAAQNIHANNPEEVGSYFCWGGLQPNKWTYYNGEGTLPEEYDIVKQTYGEGWRMPTHAEWSEMMLACDWEYVQINGVCCLKGTPKANGLNNQCIYLPAEGSYRYESAGDAKPEVAAYYWSSTNGSGTKAVGEYIARDHAGKSQWASIYLSRAWAMPIRGVMTTRTHPLLPVDMGNGLYWADANLGAISNYDAGTYFAWGDIVGNSNGQVEYDWNHYVYCDSAYNKLKKYNHLSAMGHADNLHNLLSNDDAAAELEGNGWRMPTPEEVATLEDPTLYTWEWISADSPTYMGHAGYKVTSKANGNSIFLPAAGYYSHNHIEGLNAYGAYWTGRNSEANPSQAELMCFDAIDQCAGYGLRCEGRVIRAVKNKD